MPCYMPYCTARGWWIPWKDQISSCITWWGCFGYCCQKLWFLFLQVRCSNFLIMFYLSSQASSHLSRGWAGTRLSIEPSTLTRTNF